MKYFIMMALVFSSLNSFATAPTQSTVDQYVVSALTTDTNQLKGSGKYSCKYEMLISTFGKDPDYLSYGKSPAEAQQRLALLCVKERCNQVGQWILGGLNQFDQISSSDNTEYLKSQGYSDEEIANILKNSKEKDRAYLKAMTCANSTPLARMVVVDSCFTMPMSCGK